MDHFFFDRDGKPIDVLAWARMYEDFPGRLVASTEVGPHMVITVWLGTNDEMTDPPLIFGSIVKTGELYHHEINTATEAEALDAHQQLVEQMQQDDATG